MPLPPDSSESPYEIPAPDAHFNGDFGGGGWVDGGGGIMVWWHVGVGDDVNVLVAPPDLWYGGPTAGGEGLSGR